MKIPGKLTLGSNTVEASIKGTRNTVVKILNQIEEIQNIKYKDSELPGCVDVTITTAKDKDIREELFYKMAGARCPILHINSSTMSLEDIFLQLTENPGKAEKAKTETPQAISAEESEAAQAGESEKVSGEDENVPEELPGDTGPYFETLCPDLFTALYSPVLRRRDEDAVFQRERLYKKPATKP